MVLSENNKEHNKTNETNKIDDNKFNEKRGHFWTIIALVIGILFILIGIGIIIILTPPLVININDYHQYGLPLGSLIEYIISLFFLFGVYFILAGIRGYYSSKLDQEEYIKHPIQKVFSWYLILFGISFWIFILIFVLMMDIDLLKAYISTFGIEEIKIYIGYFVEVILTLLFAGIAFIFAGKKGFHKINAYGKRNKPHIVARIFLVIFLIITIGGVSILPSFYEGSSFQGSASIPNEYPQNIGPWVEFGPTIAHKISTTSTSMEIWWFTADEEGTNLELKYGTSPNPDLMQSTLEKEEGDGHHHLVQLTDLLPATKYYYMIPSLGDNIYNFSTGPAEGSGEYFRFISVGDTRNSGGDSISFYGDINRAIDNYYKSIGEDYAFKMNVGDVNSAGSDLKSWEVYLNQSASHAATHPYMIAIGNHELGGDNGANFDYLFPYGRYYSYNYSSAHFLYINTFGGLIGNVDPAQLAFIEKDLKNNMDKQFIFVNFHVPPISTGDFNMNPILIPQLYDLFNKYKVDVVITGHDHHYDSFLFNEEQDYNGTYYFVNGGGGSPLDGYIMNRPEKTWKTWFHNRSSSFGLYQDDEYTLEGHIYGELSYGFMDVQVTPNKINITYFKWLDIQQYFDITGQSLDTYHHVEFNATQRALYNLDNVTPVISYVKYRDFSTT